MKNEAGSEPVSIMLSGRIDSGNASSVEEDIQSRLRAGAPVILDAQNLEYISSAGLRVILRVKKTCPDLKIVNVSSEVYEILEMTGFTEMMTVEKAYRVVSVEGCEVVGEGFNGKVYRIDKDNVVKVYKNADALADIQHEREVARLALILGVPTAISYDVVRVGDSYGSVFELLDARSFAKILRDEPEKLDWCVKEYVELLKKVHSIIVPEGKLPHKKEGVLKDISRMKDTLPDGYGDKLQRLAEELPDSDRMIHGDYHTKNIVLAGDDVLLIDMDTLCVGHPILELSQIYNAFKGYSEYNEQVFEDFQGFSAKTGREFWRRFLRAYFNNCSDDQIEAIEEKIRIISYSDLIDWRIRHTGLVTEEDKATVALWTERLIELLDRVDSLYFDPDLSAAKPDNELEIEADAANLPQVARFVEERLEAVNCPMKAQMQIGVAVEEIFVNIASYAYAPGKGTARVRVEVSGDPVTVTITFIDRGVPYDPLAKTDPDTALPAEEREIGGLGIFMTKKLMDGVEYEYRDGQNILTLKKNI